MYLNQRARELLHRTSEDRHFRRGARSSYRERSIYDDISPEAVRDALWLYQYGFDHQQGACLEIEMSRTRGFFGYVFEDMAVFDEALEQSMKRLQGRRPKSPTAKCEA